MSKKTIDLSCPCGSDKHYKACCGIYHTGEAAPTAEALMRSRYTAYVLKLEDYLLQTWHADTRPAALNLNVDSAIKWIDLQINHTETFESTATVDFTARYKISGKAKKMREVSQFLLVESRWFYLTGIDPDIDSNADNKI
ncbi:MAG TPA: YchJ family metal-binding protein [Methylotenera sp.]|nr:YchJ family metal-binding protein [Methylotenera sp.]